MLGEPSKLKKRRNLGKVPNRVRGGHRKFKKFQSFSWEKFKKRGGSSHFKKVPSFQKFESLKNNSLFPSHLYFFALQMSNNTLILQIVIDFVSKVPIFKLFSRFLRGSFRIKMFPSFNLSQVPFRGGVIATWELFPSFGAF